MAARILRIEKISGLLLILFLLLMSLAIDAETSKIPVWHERVNNDQLTIHLYFFWSKKCAHCLKARPDVVAMAEEYPWLKLHSLELSDNPENIKMYADMTAMFAQQAYSVPTFMFCGNILTGYEDRDTTGRLLRSYLQACYQFAKKNNDAELTGFNLKTDGVTSVEVPLVGSVSSDNFSLPVLTILIAGVDAFNPCAFFVLLFLLSMMVHSRSRKRMAIIGGVFVFVSGAIYFFFMAAWLNLFIYLGELRFITLAAGSAAILMAAINIKDYLWLKKGFSLSISDKEKPKLIDRIRELLRMDSILTVVFATIVLALAANSYELLCTAGFPMVYTRILTLNALSVESYYLYLLFYSLVYISPLLVIVTLFTIKLGSRKLSEHEGMVLKLLSGVMMLMLGSLLLVAPQLLNNVMVALALLLVAGSVTWGIVRVTDR